MEAFFIRALQLILSLSILVVLHEFGHFAFARLFKVRVEKFYMFFNPTFSLVRAKKINGKWNVKFFAKNVSATERPVLDADGDVKIDAKGKTIMEQIPVEELPEGHWHKYPENTEWGIGWLPLGGYCSIAGMVDETKDLSQMAAEPQPWEYRSRSVWQRLPIIVGGVFVNFVLAMVIYSAVLYTWGEEYLPLQNAKYGLQFSKTLQENGLKNGDRIISIDGLAVEKQSDVIQKILIEGSQNIKVARDSQQIDIQLPADLTQTILRAEEKELVAIRQPFVIAELSKGMGAEAARLQAGDSIVGLNGKQLSIFQDVADELAVNKDKQIDIDYVRKGVLLHSSVKVDVNGKLGVTPKPYTDFMQTKRTEYGLLAAIPAGVNLGWETLTSYVKQFKIVFTKEGSKQMGGFGTIGKLFPKVWDWHVFWMLTAFLSIILAFMNLLPIPALDGGYVMFLLYEMITGKKPNDKFLEYAQTAGFFLLMALLLYVNGNDLLKQFSNKVNSMHPIAICYPKCGTCQKAEKWLKANDIEYTYRPIKEENPTADELKIWLKKSGLPIAKFFNTSGLLYKEQNMKDKVKVLSESELIDVLASNGMMVKRPILLAGDKVLVGFKEEEWQQLFK